MTNFKTMVFFICTAVSFVAAYGVTAAGDEESGWRVYSREPNGDVYFFDTSRVEQEAGLQLVWSRVRYKTSIMGASSYQSRLVIDCTSGTEQILQNTFFSDKHWERPAMSTDKSEKPKRLIPEGSASERLSNILCEQ